MASVGAAALVHLPCCGLPLILGAVGASGGIAETWMHGPMRWVLAGFSILMSALSLWLVFRRKKTGCACDAEACVHQPRAHWLPKAVVVALTVISLATILTPERHDHHAGETEAEHALHAH